MTVLHYRCFTIFIEGRPAERARSLSQLQAVLCDPNSALCNKEKGERLRCYVAAKDIYGRGTLFQKPADSFRKRK